jgi:hypothetical protein
MDEAAVLVVLLGVGAQQHEVALQGIEIVVLKKSFGDQNKFNH